MRSSPCWRRIAVAVLSGATVAAAAVGVGSASASAAAPGATLHVQALDDRTTARTIVIDDLPVAAGVQVSIPALHLTRIADAHGVVNLSGLPAGEVTVAISGAGYGNWTMTHLNLAAGATRSFQALLTKSAQSRDARPVRTSGVRPMDASPCGHNSSGWTSNTKEPSTIRVWLRGSNQVAKVDFNKYVEDVLAKEWGTSAPDAAYEAGAQAVRDFAWYYVLHGSKGSEDDGASGSGCNFDVDDSDQYQVFQPGARTDDTVAAFKATDGEVMQRDGKIFQSYHCRGIADNGCGTEADSCGQYKDGDHMSQTGSMDCADKGYDWKKILNLYYTGISFVDSGNGGADLQSSGWSTVGVDGHLHVVAVAGGKAYHKFRTSDTWSDWADLGGTDLAGIPSILNVGKNYQVFALNSKGELQHDIYDADSGGWGDWSHPATPDGKQITFKANTGLSALHVNDHTHVFGIGPQGHLQHAWYDGSKWIVTDLGGTIDGTPAVAFHNDIYNVYALSPDGKLFSKKNEDGAWADWVSHSYNGKPITFKAGTGIGAVYANGHNHIMGVGTDDHPLHAWFDSDKAVWTLTPLTGTAQKTPAIDFNDSGDYDAYAINLGGDYNVKANHSGTWGNWDDIGHP